MMEWGEDRFPRYYGRGLCCLECLWRLFFYLELVRVDIQGRGSFAYASLPSSSGRLTKSDPMRSPYHGKRSSNRLDVARGHSVQSQILHA
ncbi:hypothetical protein MA16_Dca026515 [Dendrobium catenatum]|uniref:Uncharacterized protein n=1 Tax=Dendrobium catenatum TaxID=906689 RepID=A0A2I0W2R9_9ASPA|nr:hypothetical protein MA16_Dca026515 [Dendrobium catenatum]